MTGVPKLKPQGGGEHSGETPLISNEHRSLSIESPQQGSDSLTVRMIVPLGPSEGSSPDMVMFSLLQPLMSDTDKTAPGADPVKKMDTVYSSTPFVFSLQLTTGVPRDKLHDSTHSQSTTVPFIPQLSPFSRSGRRGQGSSSSQISSPSVSPPILYMDLLHRAVLSYSSWPDMSFGLLS